MVLFLPKFESMIIVTGAAGFIGSCLVSKLNKEGYKDLILVDHFNEESKNQNIKGKVYNQLVDRDDFFQWVKDKENSIQFIFHIGARTNTAEFDIEILNKLNVEYSKQIWNLCKQNQIPLVYASSAATYGLGEKGYSDDEQVIPELMPLNPYGVSKNEFDKWVIKQEIKPWFWAGFKFFNVYGPNEYHKGRMASVVFHAYQQLKKNNFIQLFKSHHPDFKDGEQQRDFVYVKDVVEILYWFMLERKKSGIYNIGTGIPGTFNQLASEVIKNTDVNGKIIYIDTPVDIREKYQYYTCAEINKLREAGFLNEFYSLKTGIEDYMNNYLKHNLYL